MCVYFDNWEQDGKFDEYLYIVYAQPKYVQHACILSTYSHYFSDLSISLFHLLPLAYVHMHTYARTLMIVKIFSQQQHEICVIHVAKHHIFILFVRIISFQVNGQEFTLIRININARNAIFAAIFQFN